MAIFIVYLCYDICMRWLNRNPKQYQPDELVRLVTTNDENVMHQATPPLWLTAEGASGDGPTLSAWSDR